MPYANRLTRISSQLLLTMILMIPSTHASALSAGIFTPSSLFVQAGVAEKQTQAYSAGATWNWPWQRQYGFGTVYGYSEASFGRWITDAGNGGSAWETQVGLTPVVRLQPSSARKWFTEIGVGVNLILPIYRSASKTFSTEFNFGDHLAIGRQFGPHNRHELALRVQHFSNGGIDHPNPGENFLQLRYSRRL
jgi:lipid A 3-O-deacylase